MKFQFKNFSFYTSCATKKIIRNFSSNIQPKEILVKPEISASEQKERIQDKPNPRTSDLVTISTSSKDSVKFLFFMDSAGLIRSIRMRKL